MADRTTERTPPRTTTSADATERRAIAKARRTLDKEDRPTPPVTAQDVERTTNERRGRETTNDGRADDGVRTTNHQGQRDETIETLKARQADLREEREEITEEIEELEEEIKRDEGAANVVGTVVDVVSAPVGGLLSVFNGGSNPIGDAAERAAEGMLGVEQDKAKLEEREETLAEQEREIAEEIDRLEDQRTLNFLADVAHVTKMPEPVADVLEGASALEINVVEETSIGSDAAYDSQTDEIVVDDDVLAKVEATIADLRDENIVDEDGNILDAAAFDEHVAGDVAIGATVLIGVHEVIHGSQDMQGKIESAAKAGQELISEAKLNSRRFGEEDSTSIVDYARYEAELQRIQAVEYDAYVMQESIELQSGKEKKVFTTINPDGSLLPVEQAVENIFALQLGMPMQHGVSQGQTVGGGDTDHDHDHDHGGEGHDHVTGASDTGGRFSGGDGAGGRFSGGDGSGGRFSGAEGTGGRFSGGDDSGGRFSGGDWFAAWMSGGDESGGRFSGGEGAGGRFSGGGMAGADETGGRFSGGGMAGADETGGRFSGGGDTGGRFSGGDLYAAWMSGGRFSGGDESGGRFSGGGDSGGRFSGAEASGGRFSGGGDTGGRFSGGDLFAAFLSGGRFSGGDDTGGRFSGGDESGGRFSGGGDTGGRFSGGDLFAAFLSGGRFSGGDDTGGRFSGGDDTGGRFSGGEWLDEHDHPHGPFDTP